MISHNRRIRGRPRSSMIRAGPHNGLVGGSNPPSTTTHSHADSSQSCRRNSAPPPPKPRGGPWALAGERSEPVRLGVRDHHACSVQRPSRVQNDARPSGLFSLRISEFESDHPGILNRPVVMVREPPRWQHLPKSLPQLPIPNAAAQTRTVSAAQIRLNRRRIRRTLARILILTDSGDRGRNAHC